MVSLSSLMPNTVQYMFFFISKGQGVGQLGISLFIRKKPTNLFIGKKETKSILQNKPGSALLVSIHCCLLFFSMT